MRLSRPRRRRRDHEKSYHSFRELGRDRTTFATNQRRRRKARRRRRGFPDQGRICTTKRQFLAIFATNVETARLSRPRRRRRVQETIRPDLREQGSDDGDFLDLGGDSTKFRPRPRWRDPEKSSFKFWTELKCCNYRYQGGDGSGIATEVETT